VLVESCELARKANLPAMFASRAGELADVLYAEGRLDEAEEWCSESERAATGDDLHARLAWEPVRAKLLAHKGSHADAETVARGLVAIGRATDALNHRARLLLDLAEIVRLRGGDDTTVLFEEARRNYEEKGNVAALTRLGVAATA
jgi:hypothetical protein